MVTETQRDNLRVLADYLDSLPKSYSSFSMVEYFAGDYRAEENYKAHNGGVHTCGAVACAVGHGPAAGFLFEKRDGIYWSAYCERVFVPIGSDEWY